MSFTLVRTSNLVLCTKLELCTSTNYNSVLLYPLFNIISTNRLVDMIAHIGRKIATYFTY